MKKLFFLLFLGTVASVTVFAESSDIATAYFIEGCITDENKEPLPGASVVIKGTTLGVGTNTGGLFSLRTRRGGTHTLMISFTGYIPQEVEVDLEKYKGNVNIQLQQSKNQLDEVIVTGSNTERPLKDVPVLTRVITAKDIQALNPMSIESLLEYELPGLQISYNSMSQMPQITYQGVGGAYLLFLVDGERVSGEGADHNVDFTRFNVDDIERIEVIKGAQSIAYGSNALGGVINIITKKATRPFTGTITGRYAGSNGQKYTASVGGKHNKFSTYTSFTYRTRDTYTIGDDEGKVSTTTTADGTVSEKVALVGSTTVYGYEIYDVSQKFGYSITEKLSADIKGQFYHNKRDIRTGYKFQDYFIDYAFNGKVKYLIAENQQLNLSYVYDNYKKDKNYFDIDFVRTDYKNRTQIAKADYSANWGNHAFNEGFEGNFEYLKHYMMKDSSHVTNEAYALYVQDNWQIIQNLNVVAGVRADYHRKYKLHVTPKVSVMYRPDDIFTLRGGYSQGFRSPSLKELYQEYDMGGLGWMMLYGNPDLEPETSDQYTLSAEATKGGMNISVSGYHNRYHNKIAYAQLGDGSSDKQYINAENAKTTGIETILQYKTNIGITLSGSYAYINDYEEVDGKNTSYVRPHSLTFRGMYNKRFRKIGTNFSFNGHWGSKVDRYSVSSDGSFTLTEYKARTLCSVSAGVELPRGLMISGGIDNLLNFKDKASDSSLQLPQRGITGYISVNINLADMFRL